MASQFDIILEINDFIWTLDEINKLIIKIGKP